MLEATFENPAGRSLTENHERPRNVIIRLGKHTAALNPPMQYAFENTTPPRASSSRCGVWMCRFPSAPTVSSRWSSVKINSTFGRRLFITAGPVLHAPAASAAAAAAPRCKNNRRLLFVHLRIIQHSARVTQRMETTPGSPPRSAASRTRRSRTIRHTRPYPPAPGRNASPAPFCRHPAAISSATGTSPP